MKTLIAYFSHRGMNYAPGGMVELKVGYTERAAKAAAELTGAPLFEIRAERDYPFDYHECVEVSKRELKENARPAPGPQGSSRPASASSRTSRGSRARASPAPRDPRAALPAPGARSL